MLLMKGTVMLIVTWVALGVFPGSKKVFLFSVCLSDFRRSFTVESNTKIKIYVGHDFLLNNEVHMSSKDTVFLELRPQLDIKSASGAK